MAAALVLWAVACNPGQPAVPDAERLVPQPAAQGDRYPSFDQVGSSIILAAAMKYPRQVAAALPPPVALTASDGTGLELIAYEADAVVDGPLAFTELKLRFRNPHPRQIEGRFTVALPPGAAVSRLAMGIRGRWQEAEVVEKQRARQHYESIVHGGLDPLLLERKAGNAFNARVFPIPARGDKDIVLSYSHLLSGKDAAYRLPLRGLPSVEDLDIAVQVRQGSSWVARRQVESHYVPQRDFAVPVPGPTHALRHGNLVVVRVRPPLGGGAQILGRVALLFDTSASRALGFPRAVRRLGELIAELRSLHGDDLHLELGTFDQQVTAVFRGPIGQLDQRHLDVVLARRPLGASDLRGALGWLGRLGPLDRAVLVTDGVATAGAHRAAALRAALRELRGQVRRLDAVVVGGIRDEPALTRIVRGALPEDGALLDGDDPPAELARRISQVTQSGIQLSVPGARWVWPHRLDGMQPGDEAVVFVRMEPGQLGRALELTLSGPMETTLRYPLRPAEGPLLVRAAAAVAIGRAADRLAKLPRARQAERAAARRRIVALSLEHRVLSDHTALLVLETELMYERFGIDRKALSDILVVGSAGVDRVRRGGVVFTGAAGGTVVAPRWTTAARRAVLNPTDITRTAQRDGRRARLKPKLRSLLVTELWHLHRLLGEPMPTLQPDSDDVARDPTDDVDVAALQRGARPYDGRMAQIMAMLDPARCAASGPRREDCAAMAVAAALAWRNEAPKDVLALVALGEALEARGHRGLAARTYGSIIDLFPGRAEMRRFAAGRLERLGAPGAWLAIDAYAKALVDRPDHLTVYRQYAFALLRVGREQAAFDALEQGFRKYPPGRFPGGVDVLRRDLGLLGAAWVRADPGVRDEVEERLAARGIQLPTEPSLRFVLTWETDANDVDLHVFDANGRHAFSAGDGQAAGGFMLADVRNGFGPELYVIKGAERAYPYRLMVHYARRGAMGYGMGKVEIIDHDGRGGLRFEQRPFVVMNDDAVVDLGSVGGQLAAASR
ncbi:MAG: hypothetical protein JRI68_13285 [Deltaproteobacteria bacterium]|nr:hypothetical protein [Deltaproteobacteria bacterium]